MPMPKRRALALIARHTVQSLLPVALSVLVSVQVVRGQGAAVWGRFVAVMLVLQLAAHVVGWGNKEQVLRALARDGAPLQAAVIGNLRARLLALGPVAALGCVGFGFAVGWSPQVLVAGLVFLLARAIAQSFEAMIAHQQRFLRAAAVDGAVGFMLLVGVWQLGVGVPALLALHAAAEVLRALALVAAFPEVRVPATLPLGTASVAPAPGPAALLREGAPFFLLSAAGMLGSRVDLYCVSALLPAAEVARYQVLQSGLLWLQSIAGLLLLPFIRAVYGMGHVQLFRLNLQLLAVGAGVAVVGVFALGELLERAHGFAIDGPVRVVGALFVAQMFAQVPAIYALYKAGRERSVLLTSAAILIGNLGLSLVLLPLWGVLGALTASAVVGWIAALSYLARSRSLSIAEGGR